MARPFKSFIADPRKKRDYRANSAEHKLLIDLAQRLCIDRSKCIRRAVEWLDADQKLLNLSPDDLRRIEDIMRVGGYKTKGEAVSAALRVMRRELMTKVVKGKLD